MAYQVQVDDEIRDANDEETAFLDKLEAEAIAKAKAERDQEKLKVDTLKKHGLTSDEVAALLS